MRNQKIAIIDPLGGYGGHHYYIDGLARGLTNSGATVSVFVSLHTEITGQEPYMISRSFGEIFSSAAKWKRGLSFLIGMARSLVTARLQENRFVNLHIFHYEWMEAFSTVLARLLGLKVILTLHDIQSFGGRSSITLRDLIIRNADGVIVHNQFCLELLKRSANLANKRVAVIPHGHYGLVYSSLPQKSQARKSIGLDSDTFTFLFFGNSRKEKGLDLLIEAVARLPQTQPWLLLTAGKMKKDEQRFYTSLVEKFGVSDRVRMDVRLISEEEAQYYYVAADLVVVPYREIYESGVAIMAQTLAAPLLVSDLPPLLETVGNGSYGRVFAAEDAEALTKGLQTAMEDRESLTELGMIAKGHVHRTRDWDRIGQLTRELMSEIQI